MARGVVDGGFCNEEQTECLKQKRQMSILDSCYWCSGCCGLGDDGQ